MPHWLIDFCSSLQETAFSQTLQNVEWVVPALQTVHILCIGAVISAALALALRQFGLLAADQPPGRIAAQFLRVIWWALPILLVTGSLLITAEPRRSLASPAFQLKMLLLVCVAALMLFYQKRVTSRGTGANAMIYRPGSVITVVALLLWVGIIFAGRWIAYAGK
jgi:uncharacterized protein DUF6644